jgi:transposase
LWLRHQPGSFLTQWFRQRVGTTRSSGEVSYRGRISKMGDCEVRRLLYVAASRMLRRDAALWCPLKVWAVRLTQRVGIRKARVALARKLAVVLHAMWRDGQVFQWRRFEAPK